MNTTVMSKNQIADASSELATQLHTEASSEVRGQGIVLPSYEDIQLILEGSAEFSQYRSQSRYGLLGRIAGARGIASVVRSESKTLVHVPAIVLEGGRIAVLSSAADSSDSLTNLSSFSDFQQTLLAGAFVQQRERTGEHSGGLAEIGHSTMIAVTDKPINIHGATHALVDSGQFARGISQKTTIYAGHQKRPTDVAIYNEDTIHALTFIPDHQAAISFDDFSVSAGFALAAVKTQASQGRKVNVKDNIAEMAEQMRGLHGNS